MIKNPSTQKPQKYFYLHTEHFFRLKGLNVEVVQFPSVSLLRQGNRDTHELEIGQVTLTSGQFLVAWGVS
uniref:Uncharacterized protein n=1 Tax=Romanomermis culicivorax TaxID=13658 RepID=A0A915K2D4_ROMCU